MHILFLSHIWPPAIDGGSQIIYQSQKHLQKLGQSILVLTTNCNSTDDFINPKSSVIKLKSTDIIRLSVYKTKLFVYLKKIVSKLLKIACPDQRRNENCKLLNLLSIGPVFKLLPLLKALNQIAKFKPDLIIAGPLPTTISLYAYLIAKIFKTKLVILPCFHHQDLNFHNPILFKTLQQSNLIWTLSTFEKNYLSKKLNIPITRFFLSPPGINLKPLTKIPPKPNNFNILFLGNLAYHKKVDLLISAFEKLSPKYKHLSLTIAGQKTLYYPQIKKQLSALNPIVRSKISLYLKKYNQETLKRLLDTSHLMVLPSINESFGIVFVEALSRGVPIIGTDIVTVKHLIQQSKSGLVFRQNNLNDLIIKIETLLNNKKLYQQFGQNGLKFSQSFNWPDIIDKLNEKIANL